MGSEPRVGPGHDLISFPVLQIFKLYRTHSHFYLFGRDEKNTARRVLKIDRTDPTELNLFEDPTNYTEAEWCELKSRIDEGNNTFDGFEEVTTCYGIIGFVRFLEPYYMLVITKIEEKGVICGHTVYGIVESQMIIIPHPSVLTEVADSLAENRYRKLMSMVDLRRNFYFSYTYHLMYSLQKNMLNSERGKVHYNSMFVWNAFLTEKIRLTLKNSMWTVALIYGFFEQTKCKISGRKFDLTVIARRSRHFAGTRYLRRGVNDMGRVANDVETEQIVSIDVPEGRKTPISSAVQDRGSIPLFWSQETSLFIPQPEIKLYKKERSYDATRHHFENLTRRYGDPIIILNLTKESEKKRRENILRAEFVKAIKFINRSSRKENPLIPFHFDLSKAFKNGAASAFKRLCILAEDALKSTDIFCCEASTIVNDPSFENLDSACVTQCLPGKEGDAINGMRETTMGDISKLQTGVLRTNCIDGLDRTNFAQYALGLVAFERQLHALGITVSLIHDLNNPLAITLMEVYQNMGDTLALQYVGSGAHSKLFCDLRGEWNLVNKQRDIFTAVRRHYCNAYLDSQKQNAINVFLGHFRPQLGNPALWELDPYQCYHMGRHSTSFDQDNTRPSIRRSFSDNILWDGDKNIEEAIIRDSQTSRELLKGNISESNPDLPICEAESSSTSFLSALCCEHHLRDTESSQMFQDDCSCSAEGHIRNSAFTNLSERRFDVLHKSFGKSSSLSLSSENIRSIVETPSTASSSRTNSSPECLSQMPDPDEHYSIEDDGEALVSGFSHEFTQWVNYGTTL